MVTRISRHLKSVLPAVAGAVAACVLFVIVGYSIGQFSLDSGSNKDANPDSVSQQDQRVVNETEESLTGTPKFSTPNFTTVEELIGIESEYLKSMALRRLLAKMDEKSTSELLDQTKALTQTNLRFRLQKIIVQKLAALNPKGVLNKIRDFPLRSRNHLVEVVFEDWSRSGLEKAVAHARNLEDEERLRVLKTIFKSRDDLPESVLRDIAQELGFSGMATGLLRESIVKSATRSPEDSWKQILEDPWKNYSQIWSLVDIADAWISAEGRDVLFQIAESIPNHLTRTEVVRRLLSQMAAHDPADAFDYATLLHERTDDSIFRSIVFRWSAKDPEAALSAVTRLNNEPLRTRMLETIASRWAQEDPHKLLENIAAFPERAQIEGRRLAIGQIARTSPHDATESLALLPPDEIEGAAEQITYWWARSNLQDVVDWIRNDSVVQAYQRSLFVVVLQHLAQQDLEPAMQFALDQPIDPSQRNLEYELIHLLVWDNRIEESLSLLPRTRDGQGKFEAYVAIGLNLLLNKEIDRALGLGEHLTASRQEDYIERLMRTWAHNDAQGLFHSINDLPNQEIKLYAANTLIDHEETLNEDQIEYVNSLVGPTSNSRRGIRTILDTGSLSK